MLRPLLFGPGPSDSFLGHVVPEAMKHLVWWDTSLLLNEFLECLTVPYRIAVPLNARTLKQIHLPAARRNSPNGIYEFRFFDRGLFPISRIKPVYKSASLKLIDER